MLLSGALFALFLAGFWLYCLTDAVLTPVAEYRGLSKPAWIAVIVVTFVLGAVAWLVARRWIRAAATSADVTPWGPRDVADGGYVRAAGFWSFDDAVLSAQAGRAWLADSGRPVTPPPTPIGPDDDPEFLQALEQAIRRNSQAD
jgi:hypothetical protein